MATKPTHMDRIVREALNDLKRHHGASWSDLSDTQQQEKLAAKLFFMVCQSAHVDAASGNPLGQHIASIQSAFIKAMHPTISTTPLKRAY